VSALDVVLDVVAGVLLVGGCLLALVAALGVLRLPDLLSRMHAATKPQVLGLVLVLAGLAVRLREPGALGVLVLAVLFQFATAPVATHMVARAGFRAGLLRRDLLVTDELTPELDSSEEPRGAP